MSDTQNLAYSLVQVAHNLGAVATVGGSLAAMRSRGPGIRRRLAGLVLVGWTVQGVSGAAFGAVSYQFYHRLPDLAGIALTALGIKVSCVAAGGLLLATYLLRGADWPPDRIDAVWWASSALAVTALSAAAFLRWFA
jgi:hypothetical protein